MGLTYTIEIASSPSFAHVIYRRSGIIVLHHSIPSDECWLSDGKYFWRVSANSAAGVRLQGQRAFSFSISRQLGVSESLDELILEGRLRRATWDWPLSATPPLSPEASPKVGWSVTIRDPRAGLSRWAIIGETPELWGLEYWSEWDRRSSGIHDLVEGYLITKSNGRVLKGLIGRSGRKPLLLLSGPSGSGSWARAVDLGALEKLIKLPWGGPFRARLRRDGRVHVKFDDFWVGVEGEVKGLVLEHRRKGEVVDRLEAPPELRTLEFSGVKVVARRAIYMHQRERWDSNHPAVMFFNDGLVRWDKSRLASVEIHARPELDWTEYLQKEK